MESNNPNTWINIQERKSLLINDPQTINVLNPSFTSNTPTDKWNDNTDSWGGYGASYHNYGFPIASNLLWQQLSGFTAGDVYTVSFDVVFSTAGYVTVKLGDDERHYSGNGTHSFEVTVDEDESSVQRISFRGQADGANWFNGGVTAVSIEKNVTLSPKRTIHWYETKGRVNPVNDVSFALTYSIADVQELGTSRGSRSKTIEVVADHESEHVFGNLSNISTTFDQHDPRWKHRVQIVTDGVTVFEGFGRLQGASYRDTQTNKRECVYEITVTDDAASFSESASEFQLSSLNLTAFDHTLNIQSIMAKSAATYGDLYCYPTLWCDDQTTYRVKDFYPAFFFMDLFDRCCDAMGYTYTFSDPFVLDTLQRCVIPYAGKAKLLSDADVQRLSTKVTLREYTEIPSTLYRANGEWATIDTWNQQIKYNTEDYDEEDQWDTALFRFQADQSTDYTLDVFLPCEIHTQLINASPGAFLQEFTDTQTMFAELAIRKNGQLLASVQFSDDSLGYQFTVAPSDGINGTLNMILSGQTFSLNQGDVITVHASHAQRHRFFTPPFNVLGSLKATLVPIMTDGASYFAATATKSEVGEGSTIQLQSYLPDLRFWDLINYARTKFNLYIYGSEYDPHLIHFDTRNDFYSGAEQLDWNDRFANDVKQKHEFLPVLVSQRLLFTDAKANDNFNKNYSELNLSDIYGQVEVDLKSDLSSGSKTIGPAKFSPTPVARNMFGHFLPALDARKLPSEPRVLLFSGATQGLGENDGLPITYWDGTANVTGYFPVSHCLMEDSVTDMNFTLAYGPPRISILTGDQIEYTQGCFERYWREYLDQVTTGKMFIGHFNLDPVEVSKLKKGLNKVVAFNGNNFTLNRVLDYLPNKCGSTKVELLLLENFHGTFNARRTSVRPFSQTGIMHNYSLNDPAVLGPAGGGNNGNGNDIASAAKSVMVVGDDNYVGSGAEGILVVGKNATVDANVKNAAAIGVRYGATLTEDGQVKISDWVEVNGQGELVEHHWFLGGIDADHTGLDQFTTDFPVILIGGSETVARQIPSVDDDEQHWFTVGGDEGMIYPEAPPDPPSVVR